MKSYHFTLLHFFILPLYLTKRLMRVFLSINVDCMHWYDCRQRYSMEHTSSRLIWKKQLPSNASTKNSKLLFHSNYVSTFVAFKFLVYVPNMSMSSWKNSKSDCKVYQTTTGLETVDGKTPMLQSGQSEKL
jgi:hypothetical protein